MSEDRARAPGRGAIARIVLAVLLLAMAAGQLVDVPGFVDVMRDYDVGGSLSTWMVAIALIAAEAVAGILLLSRDRSVRHSGARVALAVTIGWSVLALTAFARGLTIGNCGCFGVYLAQPLRWWVLIEDAEFVALAAWVLAREGLSRSPGSDHAVSGFRIRTREGATDVRAPQAP